MTPKLRLTESGAGRFAYTYNLHKALLRRAYREKQPLAGLEVLKGRQINAFKITKKYVA